MCDFLTQRGNVYWFRRDVPKALREIVGKSAWTASLGTKDRETAKLQIPLHTARTNKAIVEARAKLAAGWKPAQPPRRDFAPSLAQLAAEEEASAQRAAEEHRALLPYTLAAARLQDQIAEIERALEMPLGALPDDQAALWLAVRNREEAQRDSQWREAEQAVVESGEVAAALARGGDPTPAADKPAPTTIMGLWEGYVAEANPALSVRVRRQRVGAEDSQRGYTAKEARTILSAAIAAQPEGLAQATRDARRWVPWLLAYTGVRVGDLAALTAADVVEIEGVWTLHVTFSKTRHRQHVPLHPHLIEQGFLAFVRGRKTGPLFYDASRQRKAGQGRQHKKVGERLAEWIRDDLGITDATVAPNHAWRHRLKTEARQWGMDSEAIDVIQGHAPATTGKRYGAYPVAALAREIAKIPRYEVGGADAA